MGTKGLVKLMMQSGAMVRSVEVERTAGEVSVRTTIDVDPTIRIHDPQTRWPEPQRILLGEPVERGEPDGHPIMPRVQGRPNEMRYVNSRPHRDDPPSALFWEDGAWIQRDLR